jgi:hypothetical protein
MTSMPFKSQTMRLATKSTPYFKIHLKAYCLPGTSLLRSVTSTQKQHRAEYLRGYMVDSSHSVTPDFKAKSNVHSMCAQKSSFHTYRIENGYIITNITIYSIYYLNNIFTKEFMT